MFVFTFITSSKYPTSESNVVGVYGLITSSPRLSFPLYFKQVTIAGNNFRVVQRETVSYTKEAYGQDEIQPATYMLPNRETQHRSRRGKSKTKFSHVMTNLFLLNKFEIPEVLRIQAT